MLGSSPHTILLPASATLMIHSSCIFLIGTCLHKLRRGIYYSNMSDPPLPASSKAREATCNNYLLCYCNTYRYRLHSILERCAATFCHSPRRLLTPNTVFVSSLGMDFDLKSGNNSKIDSRSPKFWNFMGAQRAMLA